MSAYQKFIDLASPPKGPEATNYYRKPQISQVYINQHQAPTMLATNHGITMMRQHSALPNAQIVATSTPLSARRQINNTHYHKQQSATRSGEHNGNQLYTHVRSPSVYGTRCSLAQEHKISRQANRIQVNNPIMPIETDDPVLKEWLVAMRFETEVECLTSMQSNTLGTDSHLAAAMSVRDSQFRIQILRAESNFILDYVDCLIEALPLIEMSSVVKFAVEFSEIYKRVVEQTAPQQTRSHTFKRANQQATVLTSNNQQNFITTINCTPRKAALSAKTLRPLDKLVSQIRALCFEYASTLQEYQYGASQVDNGYLESSLRRLKELYGKFVEISIRIECANIVRALDYDFSQSSLNRLSSSSLLPVRPYESSISQIPLKWALTALWQLTADDSNICRVLTEKWQTEVVDNSVRQQSRVAKRLDYSTKCEQQVENARIHDGTGGSSSGNSVLSDRGASLDSEYRKLYQTCMMHHQGHYNAGNHSQGRGALSSALDSKQKAPSSVKSVSTIELLIDVIISQPNKHERTDIMNFVHMQAQQNKLIELDEWDQTVSAAIYTSNQFKVAALRILNQLCVNEQAIRTILKCFSTPPPSAGFPAPENKIIRSIFECYQTAQEHIYQNDTMFHPPSSSYSQRKRSRHANSPDGSEDYSDYGSRQTNSIPTSSSNHGECDDEGNDSVVKEAIRLLIQLTTVFHRSNQGHDFYTLIGRFSIESLVKYLTNIIKSTSNREMLFLSLTVLANISFITTEPMKLYGTNRVMLELFRTSKLRSKDLELRDQAVTILANTADKNLMDIVSNGGITFLLSCLESCPVKMTNYKQVTDRIEDHEIGILDIENTPHNRKPVDFGSDQIPDFLGCACDQEHTIQWTRQYNSQLAGDIILPSPCLTKLKQKELAAMERIQQKTAVAFARMSADPSTTKMILNYGGIKQLIELCKFNHKRNYSDTVLIACIAALRKMVKVVGSETFRHYNALDLIELKLDRALEIYGNPRDRDSQTFTDGSRIFASDV